MSGYEYVKYDGAPIKAWIKGVPVEESAWTQIKNIAKLPFIYKHVVVMPDCHWGIGATVGSVIATVGAVIPAAVGVDIGCGMMAVCTSLRAEDLPDNLGQLRSDIEAAVPHGRTNNGGPGDRGAWGQPPEKIVESFKNELVGGLQNILWKHPKAETRVDPVHQLGTLGTGNHFIEICLDEEQRVWAMLHSGSRGIGNRIGTYFIELAKEDMRRWFINLPDADLAYIPQGSGLFKDYIGAVQWAQEFALENRWQMMRLVLDCLRKIRPLEAHTLAVNCHHNYVAWENHFGANVLVTRKGAVRARSGDLGIIPGSMGAQSFIVRGKGNPDSFMTCSHGAGRAMSRTQARKQFTLAEHAEATAHVECRKDAGVIDETPGAYKDIAAVMAAQSDLIEIVHTLRQIVCVKG